MKTLTVFLALLIGSVANAQYIDSKGNEWRMMDKVSLHVSASSMLTVCSQDPCSGSIAGVNVSGYTWASKEDVLDLMREFDPAAPAGGMAQFFTANAFAMKLGTTYAFNTTYSMSEGSRGLTSSRDANGLPIIGAADYGHNMVSVSGGLGFGSVADAPNSMHSVFLYKRPGAVLPPPPPANCSFNGMTIIHGASVTMYQTSSVAYGQTCQSQVRTCDNGILSGSYTYSSCTVLAAPAPTPTPTPTPTSKPCIRWDYKKGVKYCKKYAY